MANYFAFKTYMPNMASTNRAMAFVRGFSELGINLTVCFFSPDSSLSKVKTVYPGVSFEYLWDRHRWVRMGFFTKVAALVAFLRMLKRGDRIYIYGFPLLLKILIRIKSVVVFYEIDECPEVSLPKSHLLNINTKQFVNYCKKAEGIIVISQQLKDYFVERGVDEKNVSIVNMVVDSNRFEGLEKNSGIEPYIAYCGTASNNKDGVDLLIKSFSIVAKKYPNYKLYIIGRTPDSNQKNSNLRLVKDLGIESQVVFTGVVAASDMPQLLMDASILALERPNNLQAKYGFPTKLGEYLLTGNVVVITNVGDIAHFLKDRESALIAQPGDINDFAEKLELAIENPRMMRNIGENGRLIAKRHFNYLIESKKLADSMSMA